MDLWTGSLYTAFHSVTRTPPLPRHVIAPAIEQLLIIKENQGPYRDSAQLLILSWAL